MICSACLTHPNDEIRARHGIYCSCPKVECSCTTKSNVKLLDRGDALQAYARILLKQYPM